MIMRKFLFALALGLMLAPSYGLCGQLVTHHNDTESYTPLMEAALKCDLDGVTRELKRDHAQINIKDTDDGDATALHDAVLRKCVAVAGFLLENGAGVNAPKTNGLTPLHLAARNGDMETIKLLLAHGANINAAASDGGTPMNSALKRGHPDVVEFLKSAGGHLGGKSP
jgi:ankyrin repeat protein